MQNRVVPLPSAVLSVHSSKQVFMCVYRCKHAAHRAERVSVHILPIGRERGVHRRISSVCSSYMPQGIPLRETDYGG